LGEKIKMKIAFVSYKDLANPKKNPTFCLNPLRVFNECHKCRIFKEAYNHKRLGKLKCKSKLTNEVIDLLMKKRYLLDQLAIIKAILRSEHEL